MRHRLRVVKAGLNRATVAILISVSKPYLRGIVCYLHGLDGRESRFTCVPLSLVATADKKVNSNSGSIGLSSRGGSKGIRSINSHSVCPWLCLFRHKSFDVHYFAYTYSLSMRTDGTHKSSGGLTDSRLYSSIDSHHSIRVGLIYYIQYIKDCLACSRTDSEFKIAFRRK